MTFAKRLVNSRKSGRRGAAMVEFALSFVLFILLVFAVMKGGKLIWTWTTLQHGVREGARLAIMQADNASADTNIANIIKSRTIGIPGDDITVTTTWGGTSGGDVVSITAAYHVPIMFGGLVFDSSGINIQARSSAVIVEP